VRVAVVLVFAVGCWTTASAPPVAPPQDPQPTVVFRAHPAKSPCEVAIDHVIEISHEDLDKITDFSEKLPMIRDVSVDSCNEQHWSPELIHCLGETADNSSLAACQSLLTPDQTSDVMRRITEVMTQPSQPPP
jgi:hypothetical protein